MTVPSVRFSVSLPMTQRTRSAMWEKKEQRSGVHSSHCAALAMIAPTASVHVRFVLVAQAEFRDQCAIAVRAFLTEICEQPSTLTNQFKQPAT